MRCEFATTIGGTYRITAVVADETGHRNRTQTTTWVSGGPGLPTRGVAQEQVTIVPDRETYAPGETAELLVQAPFAPASGLMTVVHRGIVSTQRFDAADGSAVLQIPIDDGDIPNLVVQIDMVGTTARTADDGTPLPDSPPRPAFATGQITLSVPPVTRALTVTATPAADAVAPGTDTSVTVQVLGPDGAPVSDAAVAVVVVDEAVLALTGYQLADPLDVFYADLWSTVSSQYTRVEHPPHALRPARWSPARWRRQRGRDDRGAGRRPRCFAHGVVGGVGRRGRRGAGRRAAGTADRRARELRRARRLCARSDHRR